LSYDQKLLARQEEANEQKLVAVIGSGSVNLSHIHKANRHAICKTCWKSTKGKVYNYESASRVWKTFL